MITPFTLNVGDKLKLDEVIVRVIYVPENKGENFVVVEEKYQTFPFPEDVSYYRLFADELKGMELVK